jgi:elongation factor 1-beta
MAKAVVTFKLMPESPEVDLTPIREKALQIAKDAGSIGEMQSKEDPIAFGLKAVLVLAMFEVEGNDFDKMAEEMNKIEHVKSAEIAKMDLALG